MPAPSLLPPTPRRPFSAALKPSVGAGTRTNSQADVRVHSTHTYTHASTRTPRHTRRYSVLQTSALLPRSCPRSCHAPPRAAARNYLGALASASNSPSWPHTASLSLSLSLLSCLSSPFLRPPIVSSKVVSPSFVLPLRAPDRPPPTYVRRRALRRWWTPAASSAGPTAPTLEASSCQGPAECRP